MTKFESELSAALDWLLVQSATAALIVVVVVVAM